MDTCSCTDGADIYTYKPQLTSHGAAQLDLNSVYDALDERGERELELASTLAARYQIISNGLKRGGAGLSFPALPPPSVPVAADSGEQVVSAPAAVSSGQVHPGLRAITFS